MSYNRANLVRIKEEYEKKRLRAIEISEMRRAELHEKSADIAALDAQLSKTGLKLFGAACNGKDSLDKQLKEVRNENESLLAARAEKLENLGYPKDYTEVHYECAACSDTGFLPNTKMCSCMKRALVLAGFRSSGLGNLIDRQSFDNFSLDYYKNDRDAFERMKHNAEIIRKYAEGFTLNGDNMLLMGGTGLGKTHLSTAMARIIIEKGFDVLYESAPNIFGDFEYDRFKSGYNETSSHSDRYFECELLIIDDLGTENSTQFTNSCLYHLLNTRLNRGLATVVNTNLTQSELLSRYGDRITSRLLGEYRILQFKGLDVRLQRK